MRLFLFYLIFVCCVSPAWAASLPQAKQIKEANELFKKEQWDQAIDGYMNALEQNKNTDLVQYDLGSAFYKEGNYDQSIQHLQKALDAHPKKDVSLRSYYNLGNAQYKKGRTLEDKKIDDAINLMQKSLESYDQALNLNSKDKDAQYNRQFVEKEIERLNKKKEEQKQKQEQNQDQKQSSDKNQQQKDGQKKNQQQNQQQNQKQNASKDKKDQEQQKAQEEKNQAEQNKKDEAQKNKDAQQQQAQEAGNKKNLEEKQAKEILEEYEREDAPKGIFNFMDRHRGEGHVDKDW